MDPKIIQRIRQSTCSVGKMAIRHEEFIHSKTGALFHRPPVNVIGTGFMVSDSIVLTRHVVEEIFKDCTEGDRYIADKLDFWYLTFTYPNGNGGWSESVQRIRSCFPLKTTLIPSNSTPGNVDAALVSFNYPEAEKNGCLPVTFGNLADIAVGKEVGICGFPLGNQLLTSNQLNRFGAVVHRGIISAIAPFDQGDPRGYTDILTDLNTAGGMSGSPIFFPDTGNVIGLHFAGCQGTLGLAQPIDEKRVLGWLNTFGMLKPAPLASGSSPMATQNPPLVATSNSST